MTLRIDRVADNGRTVIRLVGRMGVDHLDELKFQISADPGTKAIDLEEVGLVDVEAVRFLVSAEKQGLEVLNPSPYIREWMNKVRGTKS